MAEPVTVETPSTPEATPVLPISQHVEEFRTDGQPSKNAPSEGETAEEKAERLHHSAEQRRNEHGQFDEGKKRVRPSKDAAVRIAKAHEKVATAEERATASETRVAALEAEVARLKQSSTATPQQVAKAEAAVETADPEPVEDDPKFGGDYGKFLQAQARWAARDERRQELAKETKERERSQRQTAETETWKKFDERIAKAKEKYEDFDVTLAEPVPWLVGSPIDLFILEDENGPDVLQYLRTHPQERDELLRVSPVMQLRRLSLISDQHSSPANGMAVATGAVATRTETLPKPPTPVRTEARRAVEPPPTDGSLGILAHAKKFPTR